MNGFRPPFRFRIPVKFDITAVMYLIIPEWAARVKGIAQVTKLRPTEKFFDMVHKEVMNHVVEGKEPPKEIASAIMNIADDVMDGREATIRTGDYITLMNYARAKKMV
jgi:hypothetical protein